MDRIVVASGGRTEVWTQRIHDQCMAEMCTVFRNSFPNVNWNVGILKERTRRLSDGRTDALTVRKHKHKRTRSENLFKSS